MGFAASVKVKDKVKHLQTVTKKAMNVIIISYFRMFSFTFGIHYMVIRSEWKSCLSHVYVNNRTNELTSSIASSGLSGHCPVTVIWKHSGSFAKTNVHKMIQYRDFNHCDELMFLEQLSNVPWPLTDMMDDVEVKLDLFEQMTHPC